MSENCAHLERHVRHALEDFNELRQMAPHVTSDEQKLWHSLSHHLRHATYRAQKELKDG